MFDCQFYLVLGQLGLDLRPRLTLSSIAEEVHNNGTSGDSLIDIKKICAWNPAVLLSLLPRGAILANADDDIETVVAKVETLTVTLRAVTDEGEGIVLEIVLMILLEVALNRM